MRIGHVAFALLAKRARPRVSLLVLIPVAYGPDIIEGCFDVIGNHNREISHSLVSVGLVATLAALVYLAVRRNTADAAAVWLTYVSHWPADFITGEKPTWPGGPEVGLRLYDHPVWETILEIVLTGIAWAVYRKPRVSS